MIGIRNRAADKLPIARAGNKLENSRLASRDSEDPGVSGSSLTGGLHGLLRREKLKDQGIMLAYTVEMKQLLGIPFIKYSYSDRLASCGLARLQLNS